MPTSGRWRTVCASASSATARRCCTSTRTSASPPGGRCRASTARSWPTSCRGGCRPRTTGLVVLPLPFRSREHVMRDVGLEPGQHLTADVNGCYAYLDEEPALRLLGALIADNSHSDEARSLVHACFFDHGDRRPGLFTLL